MEHDPEAGSVARALTQLEGYPMTPELADIIVTLIYTGIVSLGVITGYLGITAFILWWIK